jgi:RNA polymerase subunit RPABC4/transcription elongation factor Spt4
MAGLGWKTWSTGDTVTAANFQGYLQDQVIAVFATTSARDTAISSPSDGQFAYVTAGTGALYVYDNSAWTEIDLAGDISSIVTASNSSLAGGTTSGAATLTVDVNNSTTATATAADYVLIADTDASNATKKALISDITALVTGDITAVNTASNSSLAGGSTSGAVSLTADVNNSTSATATAADYVLISDTDDSNATKKALISDITALSAVDGSSNNIISNQVFS